MQKNVNEAALKYLKPCLWIFAALLLGYDVFDCTRGVIHHAQQNFCWGWWSWLPCFYNVYLLIEVILSKNKKALIAACALLALEFAADILMLSGAFDAPLLWTYVVLYLAGIIALLVYEDNGFLKKLNLISLGIIIVANFSIHL